MRFRRNLPRTALVMSSLGLFLSGCGAGQAARYATSQSPPAAAGSAAAVTGTAPAATTAASTVAAAGPPKAYVGLFKDNSVGVIDTTTQKLLRTVPVPPGPHGLVLTPDGRKVYVSSDGDSKVSVIDTTSDQIVNSIDVGQTPHGLSISKDGKSIVVSGFGTNQEEVIETASDKIVATYPVQAPHNSAVTPDGRFAYVGSQQKGDTAIVVLDLQAKSQVAKVPVADQPRALSFSPDGKRLYFTIVGSDTVQVLDPATNSILAPISVGGSPHHPLFTPDGKLGLVVAQGPNELDLIDATNSTLSARVPVGKFPHWIGLSSDGKVAYVSDEGSNDVSVVDLGMQMVVGTIAVGNAPRKIGLQPGAVSSSIAASAASPTSATGASVYTASAGGSGQTLRLGSLSYVDKGTADATGKTALELEADDYYFSPTFIHASPGQKLTLKVTNDSGTLHNFSIRGQADQDIPAHGSISVEVTVPQSGALTFFCKYHSGLGMNGQLLAGSAQPQATS